MGRRILSLAKDTEKLDIFAAVERSDCPDLGKDAGLVAGLGPIGVKLDSAFVAGADVAIDFSTPQTADKTIDYCLENGAALVMGTTGLSDQQHDKIKRASEDVPVVYGTNMSVGMNILFGLVGKIAAMLGEDYDIEIVEQHHRFKKDAPSGSALTLAENICKATGRDLAACIVHGRSGKDTQSRQRCFARRGVADRQKAGPILNARRPRYQIAAYFETTWMQQASNRARSTRLTNPDFSSSS
jgi:4-hydroxy-tetrahydrodipicolinate reductase